MSITDYKCAPLLLDPSTPHVPPLHFFTTNEAVRDGCDVGLSIQNHVNSPDTPSWRKELFAAVSHKKLDLTSHLTSHILAFGVVHDQMAATGSQGALQ
jgi:hypothetical protein